MDYLSIELHSLGSLTVVKSAFESNLVIDGPGSVEFSAEYSGLFATKARIRDHA